MKREEFFSHWSKTHGEAEVKGIVRAWLSISYTITRPLVALRISPNTLSLLSVLAAIAFLLNINSYGTVAISTGKSSKFGAVVDAVADRIVEAIWAYAFYLLGAPWQVIVAAWVAASTQEYMRARAGGLGISQVLMVTWAERPIRATLIFIPLVGRVLDLDLFEIAAWVWAILQISSSLALFNSLRLQLQQSQR